MKRDEGRARQRRTPVLLYSHSSTLHSLSGFTLVELLVALTLFVILGTSLAGVLRSASESVNQASASLENLTRTRSLDLLLGGALNDAVDLELSSREQRMLAEDGEYDATLGTTRFRGEMRSLGFCMERPFLSAERDGYLHWVELNAVEDEESGLYSLWLKDVSFLPEIDNPIGDDWGGSGLTADERLPVHNILLVQELQEVAFSYWLAADESIDEDFEEMEPESVEGDYARSLPDRIDLELKPLGRPAEILRFDYTLREDVL